MPLHEGVSGTLAYKAYASGSITANTLATSSSDLGVSSAQYLRRVGSTLNYQKPTYQSAEIRTDRQIADFRHGPGRVTGAISGELSPLSYFPLFEAVHRDMRAAGVVLTETDLTSIAASASGSTFTFAAGDPVALGVNVGMTFRVTNASVAANNSKNFTIVSMGGTSGRQWTVTPAPTDMSADTAFSVTFPGYSTIVPLTGHVSRKFGIEHVATDLDVSRLFTECRASSYRVQAPATGMITCEFGFMGRSMETYSGTPSPFFTSPTAAATTGIASSANGKILIAGQTVGVVTGIDMSMDLSPEPAEVVGQNFIAEIFLGRANLTGTVTAYFDDMDLITAFKDETEVALQVLLTTSSSASSPFIGIFLPRIKFGGADLNLQGEGGQTMSLPFQALLADGTVTGVKQSTVLIQDSQATA